MESDKRRSEAFDVDEVLQSELSSLLLVKKEVRTPNRSKRLVDKKINPSPKRSPKSIHIKNYFSVESKANKIDFKASIEELLENPKDDYRINKESIEEIKKGLEKLKQNYDKINKENGKSLKKEEYKAQNVKYRDILDNDLTADKTKKYFHKNKRYLQDIWNGIIYSNRYQLYHKDIRTRHGLLYQMITHPFNDVHVSTIYEEMTNHWMPTEDLKSQHNDFVWKVILAEAFVKIYMDMFDLDKEEAEQRIKDTPIRPHEESKDGW